MQDYQRVVWAEGVFLGQQHFQLWEEFHAREAVAREQALHAFAWGVVDCTVEASALRQGEVRLTRCELLLPDGRLVRQAPGSEPHTLTLPSGADRAEVFVALPRNEAARGITGYREDAARCAWQVDYREVADRHDPSRTREVALARPNLLLLTGDDARDHLVTLKILELRRDATDGAWVRVPEFVPPVCQIGASDALVARLERIDERLSARIRVLDERRERLGAVADFGPADLSQFLLLQLLKPAQSELRHHLQTRSAHPETVYVALARLVAGLQSFHGQGPAAGLVPYDHDRLGEVFGSCESAIAAVLSEAVPSQMAGIRLERETDALRVAQDISAAVLERATLFLAVRFDADDPAWVSDFARQVKIGAREDIEMILSSALQGVPAVHLQRPPNRLPIKSGYEYFRLEAGGEFWERVTEHQTLAIFLPRAFSAAAIDVLSIEE